MREKTCHAQRIVNLYSTNKHFLYSIIITKQLWNLQTKLQLLKNVFRRIFFYTNYKHYYKNKAV